MKKLMIFITAMMVFCTSGLAQVAQKLRSNTGTVDLQNQILTNVQFIYTADGKNYLDADYSNELQSITFGSEGFRRIGALGGYTLEGMLEDTAMRGLARDMPIFTYQMSPYQNLAVSWVDGDVYSPAVGYYHLAAGTNTLTDNTVNYAYWTPANPNVISWTTGSRAAASNCVHIISFVCAFGRIIHAGETIAGGDMPMLMDEAHYNVMPSLIAYGLDYAPIGTNFNQIIQNAGIEFHNMIEKNTHQAKNLTNYDVPSGAFLLTYFHTNSSSFGLAITNQLPITKWDNGTNLISCTLSNWYRGVFISAAGSPSMGWVYPQAEYTNYASALAADDPALPAGFDPYIPRCTAYIFQGGDTNLRTALDYWLDRRFMIRRGSISTGGGGGGSTVPTLYQVLLQGNSTGGILPNGAGRPSQPDQLANKDYVDSTVNNINAHQAYVDENGNDGTALIESSILPFKTIQAAINAASLAAASTNRFVIRVSPGNYSENVTMKNYISLRGEDIESTILYGKVTYPSTFTDDVGAEISLITIQTTNTPAVTINMGTDSAYMGLRSCYLNTTYDDHTITNKTAVLMQRGIAEIYGTTYIDLEITTTNGPVSRAQIFEHTTDPANDGLSQMMSFNNSCVINSYDVNDDISLSYMHDNTDTRVINTIQAGIFNVHLDLVAGTYSNNFKMISHKGAIGRTLAQGIVSRLYLPATNSCNLFMGYSDTGTGDNVTILRNNHIRVVSGATSNIWLGAAITASDVLRVIDTEYVQDLSDYPYPKVYTNAGAAGKFFINTPHANGDQLFGSALDISTINSTAVSTPQTGHLKLYASPYAGLEDLYMKDSSGNSARGFRDNFYRGFNADTNAMNVGDAVYICAGLSSDNTPKVKKSIASDPTTMPAIGLVANVGGIATGRVGRIMFFGRLEQGMNTSAFASGDKLYVSATVRGGITNVAPTGSNVVQQIGTCHVSSTNGYVNVRPWSQNMFGGLYPIDYVTKAWAASNTNNINAATVGNYTPEQLQSVSATYYVYGSLAGSFTNPASKMAKLDSPYGLPVWTSTVVNVTNGMLLGYACLKTNETPRFMDGRNDIRVKIERDGDASPRMFKLHREIYESDQTTLVDSVVSGEMPIPTVKDSVTFTIAPASTINVGDYHRLVLYYFEAASGWTGTETLKVYSQNGELTYIALASATGVYVPWEEYNKDRVNWDAASAWVIGNSNGVAYLFSRSNAWDTAVLTANWVSNNTVAVSNSWYGSVAYLIASGDTQRWNTAGLTATWSSNGVVALNNGTQNWNTAYNTANWASNNTVAVSNSWYGSIAYLIVSGDTQRWNNAYNIAVATSNDWYGSIARLIISSDTQRWNTAYNTANWASNNTVAVSNSWYGSIAYLIGSSDTQRWNNAYNIAVATSNDWYGSVARLIGSADTQRWNTAGLTATWASNNTVAVSNSWYGSVAYLIGSTDTQRWNTAGLTATWASNNTVAVSNSWFGSVAYLITSGNTQNWNTAYATIGNTVTNSWGFNEPSPTTSAPNDIYLSSTFWKARSWSNFRAITESGTVAGNIVIRNVSAPIRTYTVVTNFTASTTSTNAVVLTGTIPAAYDIGVVITNVTAGTNLWISLSYSTTNGMKDL